jgi:hypothetical protein
VLDGSAETVHPSQRFRADHPPPGQMRPSKDRVQIADHPLGVSSSHFHGLRVFVTLTERCCEADLWLPIGFRKCLGDRAFTEIRRFQIAEKPPSTDNSTPFTKLESSEARSRATAAISSGRLIFPRGIRDSNISLVSSSSRWESGVSTCPGLSTFARIFLPFSLLSHVRANER